MTRPMTLNKLLIPAFLLLANITKANNFATTVVSFSNLGVGVYGDPNAALGAPAQFVKEPNGTIVGTSPGYPAWNRGLNDEPLVVTIRPGGQLTVRFDPPIRNLASNWYGYDFIVFGNSGLGATELFSAVTDLSSVFVTDGDWMEPTRVSVSPDGFQWYEYPLTVTTSADTLWPTLGNVWNAKFAEWNGQSNPTKPVSSQLTRAMIDGWSFANLAEAYQGSAGGTAFDLSPSGFQSIRFIRFTGSGGEVDAVARVGRQTSPAIPIQKH